MAFQAPDRETVDDFMRKSARRMQVAGLTKALPAFEKITTPTITVLSFATSMETRLKL
jgi:hypothetical protein